MKNFHLIVAAIVAVLGMLWYVPAMIWGYQASTYTMAAQNGDLTPEENADRMAKIIEGPAPLAWLRNRSDVRDHFRLDEFTVDRRVSFEEHVDFEQLLAPGEARPDPSLLGVYATARAPAYFAPMCEELLEVIAKACKVFRSDGRHMGQERNPDRTEISSGLAYIPSYPLGDPSAVSNGRIRTAYVTMENTEMPYTKAARRRVLEHALAVCAEVRTELGNCVIGAVTFTDWTDLDGNRFLRAGLHFAVYADQTVVGRRDLPDIVARISTSLEAQTG